MLARASRTTAAEWPARVAGFVRRVFDRIQPPRAPEPGPLAPLPVPRSPAGGTPPPPPAPEPRPIAAPTRSAHDIDVLGLPFDPRVAWEAGRLQDLAWAATQGATWATDRARDFLAHAPPGRGLHWASSLEVALRLVSLAVIADRHPSDDLARAIAIHAAWVARHPSVGTSVRNHRVGELCGLAVAAAVLPECPERASWTAQASALGEVLRAQLHADGLGVEQSTHYLCFVLELGWIAWHCGVENLADPLGRGLRALHTLLDDRGHLVHLGDDDGGRAWPDAPAAPGRYGSVVAERLEAVLAPGTGPPPGDGGAWFPRAGLTVFRHRGVLLAFDHGPLGEPWLGAHGHDDPLSITLHLPDGPAIVGRGTGSYHDPATRRFHRSAAAHATLTALDRGPSEPHDHPFLWRRRARATLECIDLDRGRVLARHDGYASGRRGGLELAREIRFVGRTLLVDDRLRGIGEVPCTWSWPLDPRLHARLEGGRVVVDDGARDRLVFDLPAGFTVELLRGGERPGPGWHAAGYGRWVHATTIRVSGTARAPARLLTRIGILEPRPVVEPEPEGPP